MNDDLSFWLSDVPEIDRNRDEYIVLPSNGMITPINVVPNESADYSKLVNGREINVNQYLKSGVLVYPGTNSLGYGSVGNTVIFGHSSYFKNDTGRYKTHFQKIIELESGEEIWVYQKQEDASYKRFRYIVTTSYNTPSSDTSVLAAGIGKNLTLFTCTPIGGISGRWIVQAKYIDEEKQYLESVLFGANLTKEEKNTVKLFLDTLKGKSDIERKSILLKQFETLTSQKKKSPLQQYFLMQIAKSYHTL